MRRIYPGIAMADRKKNGHVPHANGKHAKNGKGNGHAAPKPSVQYNCSKCPGYCCSYPVISLTKYDAERLGKHYGISAAEAEKKFTKAAHGHKRIFRRKKDPHFGMICRFFDT